MNYFFEIVTNKALIADPPEWDDLEDLFCSAAMWKWAEAWLEGQTPNPPPTREEMRRRLHGWIIQSPKPPAEWRSLWDLPSTPEKRKRGRPKGSKMSRRDRLMRPGSIHRPARVAQMFEIAIKRLYPGRFKKEIRRRACELAATLWAEYGGGSVSADRLEKHLKRSTRDPRRLPRLC
jgi:hypothetical protein